MIVCGAGTGGTITGIARAMHKNCPDFKVIGVDPHGSIIARPNTLKTFHYPYGIGCAFQSKVIEYDHVYSWIKTCDRDSFKMARRLIRDEGLLVGGSSGSAMWAAMKAAESLKSGQNCVVILPDSLRNYISKFLDDDWMNEYGFLDKSDENSPL